MKKAQIKYYIKQLSKPVSLVSLLIGFIGVLLGAAGLMAMVHYGTLIQNFEQQQDEQALQAESTVFPIMYQVKAGDSTWKLAKQFYGEGLLYPAIEQANDLEHDAWLEVGQMIVLPAIGQFEEPAVNKADNVQLPYSEAPSASGENCERLAESASAAKGTYTVQPGDSLWLIAKQELGDGYRWPELYKLNSAIIGSDPDLIYPETVLNLPCLSQSPLSK